MHAGNDHNPIGFYFEEKTVREASYAHPTYFRMHNLEGEGTSRDDLYCSLYRQSKTHAKVRMNAFVPGERFLEIRIRFWYPDNRQCHCFLNRPARTSSQAMTSSGLRSYWPMR